MTRAPAILAAGIGAWYALHGVERRILSELQQPSRGLRGRQLLACDPKRGR